MNENGNGNGKLRKSKRTFSTGQAAKICDVAPRTVSKWFDSGCLKGYRIPGSKDRRIPRDQLIRFLKENGMPLGELANQQCRVLLVGVNRVVGGQIADLLPGVAAIESAASAFEAGVACETWKPDVVVLDLWLGRGESIEMAARIRMSLPESRLVALVGEDGADLPEKAFDHELRRPFAVEALTDILRTIAEAMQD